MFFPCFLPEVPPAWSPPPECAAALSRVNQPLERRPQGSSWPTPSQQCLAGGKQLRAYARKEGGDLQRQIRWVMTFKESHIFGSEVFQSPGDGSWDMGGFASFLSRTEDGKARET